MEERKGGKDAIYISDKQDHFIQFKLLLQIPSWMHVDSFWPGPYLAVLGSSQWYEQIRTTACLYSPGLPQQCVAPLTNDHTPPD